MIGILIYGKSSSPYSSSVVGLCCPSSLGEAGPAGAINLIVGRRSMSLFGGFAADELDSAVSFDERAAIWRRQASGLPR